MYTQTKQRGASAIGLIIVLLVAGYAVYVGIQYIPQRIEFNTLETILSNIEQDNRTTRLDSQQAVENALVLQLNVNLIDDQRDNFRVSNNGSAFTIALSYERALNLGYETKQMKYEKTVTLK